MQRFLITTLGCKVNQYDGSAVSAILHKAGMLPASPPEQADLLVIVTCCVTKIAMSKSRQAIRKALRSSPGASVIAAGCYSDYDAAKLTELLQSAGVSKDRSLILGHHGDLAGQIHAFVASLQAGSTGTVPTQLVRPGSRESSVTEGGPASLKARRLDALAAPPPASGLTEVDRFTDRQRAFVKVQDGCDAFCTYCIVPYLRCRVWSRSIDDIEAQCHRLVAAGHKEIVLSGVFLGAFGRSTAIRRNWDSSPAQLPQLVTRIAAIDGLWRLRLSSLEPGDLTDELLAACCEAPNIAPHFHLPLQSGSDKVLSKMNRQYTSGEFRDCINRLHNAMDRPAITTDIIVGFPGETDSDFAATLELAEYARFAKIHTFPFSAIEPTAAWTWRGESSPPNVVRQRIAELGELEARLATDYRKQFVGGTMEALVEGPRNGDNHSREAMTDRYIKVKFTPPDPDGDLTGQVVRLTIHQATDDGLLGSLTD